MFDHCTFKSCKSLTLVVVWEHETNSGRPESQLHVVFLMKHPLHPPPQPSTCNINVSNCMNEATEAFAVFFFSGTLLFRGFVPNEEHENPPLQCGDLTSRQSLRLSLSYDADTQQ